MSDSFQENYAKWHNQPKSLTELKEQQNAELAKDKAESMAPPNPVGEMTTPEIEQALQSGQLNLEDALAATDKHFAYMQNALVEGNRSNLANRTGNVFNDDPNSDAIFNSQTALGAAGNNIMGAASGVTDLVAGGATLAASLIADSPEQSLEQSDFETHDRLRNYTQLMKKAQQGYANAVTEEQQEYWKKYANQLNSQLSPEDAEWVRSGKGKDVDKAFRQFGFRKQGKMLSDAVKKYVDHTATEELNESVLHEVNQGLARIQTAKERWDEGDKLGAGLEMVDASLDMIANGGSEALGNSTAIFQTLAESLPQLIPIARANTAATLIGATGAVGSAAYGRNELNNVLARFEETGEIPASDEEKLKLMTASLTQTTAELLGDRLLGGAFKGLGTPSETASMATLIAKRAIGQPLSQTAEEGLQEAVENIAEQYAVKQDFSEIDPAEFLTSGVIGGVAGGVASVGGLKLAEENLKAPLRAGQALAGGTKAAIAVGKAVKNSVSKKEDAPKAETPEVDPVKVAQATQPTFTKEVPTEEEITENESVVQTAREAFESIDATSIQDEEVRAAIETVQEYQSSIPEEAKKALKSSDPEEQLIGMLQGAISTKYLDDQVTEEIANLKNKEGLSESDRQAVSSLETLVQAQEQDSVAGKLAALVKADSDLGARLDTAVKELAETGDIASAIGNFTNEAGSKLAGDTNKLKDVLAQTVLYSHADILEDDSFTADELSSLSDQVTSPKLAKELSNIAEYKRTINDVTKEFTGIKGTELPNGSVTEKEGVAGYYAQLLRNENPQEAFDNLKRLQQNQTNKQAAYNDALAQYNENTKQPVPFTYNYIMDNGAVVTSKEFTAHPVLSRELGERIQKELDLASSVVAIAEDSFKNELGLTEPTLPVVEAPQNAPEEVSDPQTEKVTVEEEIVPESKPEPSKKPVEGARKNFVKSKVNNRNASALDAYITQKTGAKGFHGEKRTTQVKLEDVASDPNLPAKLDMQDVLRILNQPYVGESQRKLIQEIAKKYPTAFEKDVAEFGIAARSKPIRSALSTQEAIDLDLNPGILNSFGLATEVIGPKVTAEIETADRNDGTEYVVNQGKAINKLLEDVITDVGSITSSDVVMLSVPAATVEKDLATYAGYYEQVKTVLDKGASVIFPHGALTRAKDFDKSLYTYIQENLQGDSEYTTTEYAVGSKSTEGKYKVFKAYALNPSNEVTEAPVTVSEEVSLNEDLFGEPEVNNSQEAVQEEFTDTLLDDNPETAEDILNDIYASRSGEVDDGNMQALPAEEMGLNDDIPAEPETVEDVVPEVEEESTTPVENVKAQDAGEFFLQEIQKTFSDNIIAKGIKGVKKGGIWAKETRDKLTKVRDLAKAKDAIGLATFLVDNDLGTYSEADNTVFNTMGENFRAFQTKLEEIAAVMTAQRNKRKKEPNRQGQLSNPIEGIMILNEQGNLEFPKVIQSALFLSYYDTLGSLPISGRMTDAELANALQLSNKDDLYTQYNYEELKNLRNAGGLLTADHFASSVERIAGISFKKEVTGSIRQNLLGALGSMLRNLAEVDTDNVAVANVSVKGTSRKGFKVKKAAEGSQKTFLENYLNSNKLMVTIGSGKGGSNRLYVGTKPKQLTKKNHKKGNTTYSQAEIEAENAQRNQGWGMNLSAKSFFGALTEEGYLELIGAPSSEEIEQAHYMHAETLVGKRIGAITEFANFQKALELVNKAETDGVDASMYFTTENSTVGRSHISQSFDPNANKFHRMLLETNERGTLTRGSKPIKLATRGFNNKILATDAFVLALGQAFGLDADKQSNKLTYTQTQEQVIRPAFDAYFNDKEAKDPYINAAVRMADSMDSSGKLFPTDEAFAAIQEAFDGNTNFHKFQGAIDLARLLKASPDGITDPKFTHGLRFEIDGVTNGPHHNKSVFAVGSVMGTLKEKVDSALQTALKGGIIPGHETKGIQEIIGNRAKNGHTDLYESVGTIANEVALEQEAEFELLDPVISGATIQAGLQAKTVMSVLKSKTINIAGNKVDLSKVGGTGKYAYHTLRNLFKNPVTQTVYGAGNAAITNSITAGIVKEFYADVTRILNSDMSTAERESALKNWDTVFGLEDKSLTQLSDKQLRAYPADTEYLEAALNNPHFGIAATVNEAINRAFADSKEVAAVVNFSQNFLTNIGQDIYEKLYLAAQKQKIEKGELEQGEALSDKDLSQVLKTVKGLVPGIRLSITDKPANEAVMNVKEDRQGKVVGNTSPTLHYVGYAKGKVGKISAQGGQYKPTRNFQGVGVSTIPRVIISVDASMQITNHRLQGDRSAYLNVFDAIDAIANDKLRTTAEIANIAEYIAMMSANPIRHISDSLQGVMRNLQKTDLNFHGQGLDLNLSDLFGEKDLSELDKDSLERRFVNAMAPHDRGNKDVFSEMSSIASPTAFMEYITTQIDSYAHNADVVRANMMFGQTEMTVSQMGGIDNGVARIHEGKVVISDEVKEQLSAVPTSENGTQTPLEIIETFNEKMGNHYDRFKKGELIPKANHPLHTNVVASMENVLTKDERDELDKALGKESQDSVERFLLGAGVLSNDSNVLTFKNDSAMAAMEKVIKKVMSPKATRLGGYTLSEKLKEFLRSVEVSYEDVRNDKGQAVYGSSEILEDKVVIKINPNNTYHNWNNRGKRTKAAYRETVLVHELVHALTTQGIDKEINAIIMQDNKLPIEKRINNTNAVSKEFREQYRLAEKMMDPRNSLGATANRARKRLQKHWDNYQKAASAKAPEAESLLGLFMKEHLAETISLSLNVNLTEEILEASSENASFIEGIRSFLQDIVKRIAAFFTFNRDAEKAAFIDPAKALVQQAMASYSNSVSYSPELSGVAFSQVIEEDPQSTFESYSSHDLMKAKIHEAAENGENTPEELERLNNLVDQLSSKFLSRIRSGKTKQQLKQDEDATQHLHDLKNAGFYLSKAEEVVFNAVSTALTIGGSHNWLNHKALASLHKEARNQLKYTDLLEPGLTSGHPEYEVKVNQAKEQYRLLFKNVDSGTLGNFAALAAVSGKFRDVLGKVTLDKTGTRTTSPSYIKAVTNRIFASFVRMGERVANIPRNSTGDAQITAINTNMLKSVRDPAFFENKFKGVETTSNKIIQSIGRNGYEALLTFMANVSNNQGLIDYKNADQEIRSKVLKKAAVAILAGTKDAESQKWWQEWLGQFIPLSVREGSLEISRHKDRKSHHQDSIREDTIVSVRKNLEEAFHRELTREEDEALSYMVRMDPKALYDTGTTKQALVSMLNDDTYVDHEIRNQMANLRQFNLPQAHLNFMLSEAASLGWRTVTGGVYEGLNLPNAYAISNMVGTGKQPSHDVEAVAKVINSLSSSMAIKAMSESTRSTLANLLSEEISEGSEGTDSLIKMHNHIPEESGYPEALIKYGLPKGYVRNSTVDNTHIAVVPRERAKKLKGYRIVRPIAKGPQTASDLVLVRSTEGGALRYVQGAASTVESTLGSFVLGKGHSTDSMIQSYNSPKKVAAITAQAYKVYAQGGMNKPKRLKDGVIPSVNSLGKIVGYHHALSHEEEMNQGNKEALGLTQVAEQLARTKEERVALQANSRLVKTLHRQYMEATIEERDRYYVSVSAQSKDAKLREIWKVLPTQMKAEAKGLFGADKVMVHRLDLNNALGFREASVARTWDENSRFKAFSKLADAVLGKNALNRLRFAERLWQEGVATAKDIITVRSIVVPVQNLLSNLNQLHLNGIPAEFIKDEYVNAVNAAKAYKKDYNEYIGIRHKIAAGIDVDESRIRKLELEQELRHNPVTPLVKEGLLPNVIEDLAEAKEHGARDQLLSRYLPEVLKKDSMPKKVFNEVMINEGSSLHGFLSESLELGDFGAKFVLYRWQTQQGIPANIAMDNARVEFINYGTLTGRSQDYFNKMGLIFFWKYFQRSQAIMFKMMRENPARSLLLLGGIDQAIDIPDLYEAFIGTKDLSYTTGPLSLTSMAGNMLPVNQVLF